MHRNTKGHTRKIDQQLDCRKGKSNMSRMGPPRFHSRWCSNFVGRTCGRTCSDAPSLRTKAKWHADDLCRETWSRCEAANALPTLYGAVDMGAQKAAFQISLVAERAAMAKEDFVAGLLEFVKPSRRFHITYWPKLRFNSDTLWFSFVFAYLRTVSKERWALTVCIRRRS